MLCVGTRARIDGILQVEELSQLPNQPQPADEGGSVSAPDLAARALDQELNGASATLNIPVPGQVNDLTGIVKKKKKAPAVVSVATSGKRKADDEGASPTDKKAKLDDAP